MKKIIVQLFLLLICVTVAAQNNLTFSPAKPHPGDAIEITYTPPTNLFSDKDVIQLTIFKFGEYDDQEAILQGIENKSVELPLKKKGNSYQATIPTDAKTQALAFNFSSGKLKVGRVGANRALIEGKFDLNDSLGYVVPFYDEKGKDLTGSNFSIGEYYLLGALPYGFRNPKLARTYFLKEIELYPDKSSRTLGYLSYTYSDKDRSEFEPVAKKQLELIFGKDTLTEIDYGIISSLFYALKLEKTSKYFRKESEEKFKNETTALTAYSLLWDKFDNEKEIEKKYTLLSVLNNNFNQLLRSEKISFAYNPRVPYGSRFTFLNYVLSKSKGNLDQFNQYAAKLNYNKESTLYYSNAILDELEILKDSLGNLNLAEKKGLDYLNFNKQQYAKLQKGEPASSGILDEYLTKNDKLGALESSQIILNEFLSDVSIKKGNEAKAFKYIKAAREVMKQMGTDYYDAPKIDEQYVILAEKQLPTKELKSELEKIITTGKWTTKFVDKLKDIYVKEKGSDAGFDPYLAGLKKSQIDELKKSLVATQVNEPAPAFTVTDLDGKTVSLSDYKGKTVILDFWATWCGPCKASFPGMKKLQEFYKGNESVKLLFVDTFERFKTEDENIAAVKEFLSKNDYPFHVLLDNRNKSKVATDYSVSGIPTKVIIDKNGNIRYKITGTETNEGKLLDEVNAMLETIK